MRRAVLLLATVAATVLFAGATGLGPDQRLAQAQTEEDGLKGPTLQFGCAVVKTAAMDPIFDPEHPHEHVFYGNRGVEADSTYESLVSNKDTSCSLPFATSSYWNPVVKDGPDEVNQPKKVSVYYVGKGDQTRIKHIPDGLQLLGNKDNGRVDYRCGAEPAVSSPPYGCAAEEFRIRVHFPECWNRSSLAPDSLVRMTGGACPSSHPYQIPSIRMAVHYQNVGGVLNGPLQVSAGGGEFLGADFFHADVFAAPQEPDFRDTIKKCVNDVADGAVPPAVCRPGLRPETALDPSGPSGTVASGSGTFAFSSPEPDATFQCRVYEVGTTPGSFGTCSGNGTHDVSGLEAGKSYTFEVRAVEPFGGQEDLTPASRTWTTAVDTTAPTVAEAPAQSFVTPSTLGTSTVPVKLTWSATDNTDGSGVASYQLQRSVNGGTYSNVTLPSATTTTITPSLTPTYTYRYRVAAKDKAGNVSAWAYGPSFKVNAYQENATAVTYPSGTWARAYLSGAYGSYVKYAKTSGATAKLSFTGRNVAWVAPKSSTRGEAEVYVDGTYVQTVDLYSSSTLARQVVFSKSWATSESHTLEVRLLGTSGRPRVDLDAFAVLQ